MNCDSCQDKGWVHLDYSDGTPDGVYNCDCALGQALTWAGAYDRHRVECSPTCGYGPPHAEAAS